jgi:hypothetical protein
LIGFGCTRKSGRFGDFLLLLESSQLRVDEFFSLAVIQKLRDFLYTNKSFYHSRI